ncbi:MAG: alpha-L-fucosidase [Muribaculaceae bacterium]|nr:alpha-L-fucosidase [Muribaculaceae bacterium]
MKHSFTLSLLGIACIAASASVTKVVDIPADADMAQRVAIAANLVPNEQQLLWQQRPLTAFLHFGINTFTDREWGDGSENPDLFNPTDLDTDQWVKTLHDAGFDMVILTAKHHDGFCLWPTKTTNHSVASSSWRNGKGDVVADLRRSCDKYGMKMGIYLSPWDRNASCYGDSPRYNDMFVAQLTELLTNYGTIDEVWFDGACAEGPNGKRQEYDWLRFREVMRTLQPQAVLAITGDDVRWVGNEGGVGRETEWSVTPLTPSIFPEADSVKQALGINEMSHDLGSRDLLAKASRLYWWPSEVDVSIRPGWFYHPTEQPKSLQQLADIYLQSVGRNSVLLLNVPPDRRGLIAQADSIRLMELKNWIDAGFTHDLTATRRPVINAVSLSEDITKGQRVELFEVLGYTDGVARTLAQGTTIGHRRILTFEPTAVDSVSVKVINTRATPHITINGIYSLPQITDEVTSLIDTISPIAIAHTDMIETGGSAAIYYRLDQKRPVGGFIYTPGPESGKIYKYTVVVHAADGWHALPQGEFGNIQAMPDPRVVILPESELTDEVVILINQTLDGPVTLQNTSIQFFEK